MMGTWSSIPQIETEQPQDVLNDVADFEDVIVEHSWIKPHDKLQYILNYWIRQHLVNVPKQIIDVIIHQFLFQQSFNHNHIVSHRGASRDTLGYLGSDSWFCLKFIIIGDTFVGKSSFLMAIKNASCNYYNGAHYFVVRSKFVDDEDYLKCKKKAIPVMTQISEPDSVFYSSGGNVLRSCYSRINGVIIVYDVSNKQSLCNLKYWNDQIDQYLVSDKPKILVGNKSDLENQISLNEAKCIAKQYGILNVIHVSSFTKNNVNAAFTMLLKNVFLPYKRLNYPFYG